MKLYPLLFLNEGQVFANQAYNQGLVLIKITHDGEHFLILLNKNQIKDKATGELKESGQGIIYGGLQYSENEESGNIQTKSADAIQGYGPLLYQAAMYLNRSKWLESHESLSKDSYKVWNKMYEFSEQGIYKRKYIGNIGYSRDECANKLLDMGKVLSEEERESEEAFLKLLKSLNVKPEEVGCFWAYKKTSHEPEIALMLKEGKNFFKKELNNNEEKLFSWFRSANLRQEQ
jgi:hypothetical protein